MDVLKNIYKLILVAALLMPAAIYAETGVAFVHGTGKQVDALNDYWTWPMVDSIRQGLSNPDNYFVINCDFDQYMWKPEAAGCLAEQLTGFIDSYNITDLVIITHSNGGNIMRWILSNPTWDSRYLHIIENTRWVIALAPSSLGTPLADAVIDGNEFEQVLGWLLGYASDAVRMQQLAYMAYFNQNWLLGTAGRPGLPLHFYNVVGSDVNSAVWDPDSYCGGYAESVALEVTQLWLDSCSDGFLDCKSQAGVKDVSFKDINFTDGSEPLNHNQSRRDCFGLDVRIRNKL
jgi:pimeloyl-ACP methyl ester carboxylesterase